MTEPDPFAIESSAVGDRVVVTVFGELDMSTAPQLTDAFALIPESIRTVVIDLSHLAFIDSSGLNALMTGRRRLAATGSTLRVVAPPGNGVRRVFEITHLAGPLGLSDTVEDPIG